MSQIFSSKQASKQASKFNLAALPALACTFLLVTSNADAALYDNGNGLVYDNALNVTWSKDGNLISTMVHASPTYSEDGGGEFIQQVINANGGKIGEHNLTVFDFGAQFFPFQDGRVSWYGAQAFLGYLNSTSWQGYNDWRLPAMLADPGTPGCDPIAYFDCGAGVIPTTSELAYLYSVNLGNQSTYAPDGKTIFTYPPNLSFFDAAHNNLSDSFNNLQNGLYWLSGNYANLDDARWNFEFSSGVQNATMGLSGPLESVWVVRTVPSPGAALLFASGLIGLIGKIGKTKRVVV